MESIEQIRVRGGGPLEGTIPVGGAKNSVLKLMAATLLAEGSYHLHNVPRITDVDLMSDLLCATGCSVALRDRRAVPCLDRRHGSDARPLW